jgi:hypothetical protein
VREGGQPLVEGMMATGVETVTTDLDRALCCIDIRLRGSEDGFLPFHVLMRGGGGGGGGHIVHRVGRVGRRRRGTVTPGEQRMGMSTNNRNAM